MSGQVITTDTFLAEIVSILAATGDIARFDVSRAPKNQTVDQLIAESLASPSGTKSGEIRVRHADRNPEPLAETSEGILNVVIDDWELLVIDAAGDDALTLLALREIDRRLNGRMLTNATGRITYTRGWLPVTDRDADLVQGYLVEFQTNYDELPTHSGDAATGATFFTV